MKQSASLRAACAYVAPLRLAHGSAATPAMLELRTSMVQSVPQFLMVMVYVLTHPEPVSVQYELVVLTYGAYKDSEREATSAVMLNWGDSSLLKESMYRF